MTVLTNNGEFVGPNNSPHRQVTLATGVTANIEMQTKAADGTIGWVDIPDGFLTGPTSVTILTVPGQVYRVSNVSGGSVWVS